MKISPKEEPEMSGALTYSKIYAQTIESKEISFSVNNDAALLGHDANATP